MAQAQGSAQSTGFQPVAKPALAKAGLFRPDSRTGAPRPAGRIYLDKNENNDPQLERWYAELLTEMPPAALNTYPDLAELYRKLANWLEIPAAHLALTTGCDGAIHQVFEIFVSPGDRVLITQPTFAMYPVYSAAFGAEVTPLAYDSTSAGPLLTVEHVVSQVEQAQARLLCLPNPDSPTGSVFSLDELRTIAEACSAVGTILLIDEAYHPFSDVDASSLALSYPNVIVARTFSKAWGLAGLRVGYVIGCPETVEWFHTTRPMYEIGAFPTFFVSRVLDEPQRMLDSVARIKAGKEYFSSQMRELGFEVLPSGGNFVHVAFGEAGPRIHDALRDIVLYRADGGDGCLKGYSRFSMTTVEILQPLVGIIAQASHQ